MVSTSENMNDWKEKPSRNLAKCLLVERTMEKTRYSWSGKNVNQLGSTLRSRGFDVKEDRLPKPEIKIAYRERIEVKADKYKAFLDPYTARLTCQEELTEKDRELERLLETEYPHKHSFETAIIYPAILALGVAFALRLLR